MKKFKEFMTESKKGVFYNITTMNKLFTTNEIKKISDTVNKYGRGFKVDDVPKSGDVKEVSFYSHAGGQTTNIFVKKFKDKYQVSGERCTIISGRTKDNQGATSRADCKPLFLGAYEGTDVEKLIKKALAKT